MPVFIVTTPDGEKVKVEAPEGATHEQVIKYVKSMSGQLGVPDNQYRAEIKQPDGAYSTLQIVGVDSSPRQIGFGLDSAGLIIVCAVAAFGITFHFGRKISKLLSSKTQKVLLGVAGTIFGIGFLRVLNEIFVIPHNGLTADNEGMYRSLIVNMLLIPSIIGFAIWLLRVKSKPQFAGDNEHASGGIDADFLTFNIDDRDQPADELYAQALAELEGGQRKKGVWAKCLAEANGVEQIAQAQYIRTRAVQLNQAKRRAK